MPMRDQRVVDAPDRAEQADERGGRADRRQEGEPVCSLLLTCVDRALQRHGDPLVQVDAVREAAVMMGGGAQAVLGDHAEVVALLQALDAVLDRRRSPELLLDDLGGLFSLRLVPQLRQDDVPGERAT